MTNTGKVCRKANSRGIRAAGFLVMLLISAMWAAELSAGRFNPPPPVPDDRRNIPQPVSRDIHHIYDGFMEQFVNPVKERLDLSKYFRKIFRKPKEAMNVDAFDEVADCAWFVNRNTRYRMTLEEIARGPDAGVGPDTSDVWTIFRAKTEGVTPGLQIIDSLGDRYVIKFDPYGFNELASGAEVVSTKLFYAAGYHVPENYITYFNPRILKLGEEVKFTDQDGNKRFMTKDDLAGLLSRLEYQSDGRVRVAASRYVAGRPIGPYRYSGTRLDDPNDIIPHQHRRDLRAQRVVCSWLSHHDTKANNTLDSYVTVDGRSYVRHYLIDFGSVLGSAAIGPKQPFMGHENYLDANDVLVNALTLGLHVHSYERHNAVRFPSIGLLNADGFKPEHYEFNIPIPAYRNLTDRDGYWGARIVMSFTDKQIATAVAQGQYSDPEAAEYLTKVLIARRDIVGRYWFGRMPPLDNFLLSSAADGTHELNFDDLAVSSNLEQATDTKYRYELRKNDKKLHAWREIGSSTKIVLADLASDTETVASKPAQWEINLAKFNSSKSKWSRSVRIYLEQKQDSGQFAIIGLKR